MRRFVIGGLIVAGFVLGVVGFITPSAASTTNQASDGRVDIGHATATPCASPVGRGIDPGFTAALPPGRPGDPGLFVRLPHRPAIDPGFSLSPSSCGLRHPVVAP